MPETETKLMIQLVLYSFAKNRPVEMKIVISATKETLKAQAALEFNTNNTCNKL